MDKLKKQHQGPGKRAKGSIEPVGSLNELLVPKGGEELVIILFGAAVATQIKIQGSEFLGPRSIMVTNGLYRRAYMEERDGQIEYVSEPTSGDRTTLDGIVIITKGDIEQQKVYWSE